MKIAIRIIFCVLLTSVVFVTYAQTSSSLSVTNITGSGNTWGYGTVVCTSTNNVTSITLSMINNRVVANNSGIQPSSTYNSLGNNPRTTTYVFAIPISTAQVQDFIKGISFMKTTEIAGANNFVRISVDANPTLLPANASITVWDKHPDGTLHYYVWVNSASIHWDAAYNGAKSYYFQGMRGYLATITTNEENTLLTNISAQEGWSAGIRSETITDDKIFTGSLYNNYAYFRWACGPETGFQYFHWQVSVPSTDAGNMNNAFNAWNRFEPNSARYPDAEYLSQENCMQVNFSAALKWNDYSYTTPAIRGYFIEFGGSGDGYSVGSANYPANPAYIHPTVVTDNAQWYLYSPGNTSSAVTTIKKSALRSNVMVLE